MKQYIKLKPDVDIEDMLFMHPSLMLMFSFVSNFCYLNNIEMIVTSIHRTPEENRRLGATSRTHIEYRAFDLSIKAQHGWNSSVLSILKYEIEKNFKHIGAISSKSGESRPIYIHGEGDNLHAHFQVRPGL